MRNMFTPAVSTHPVIAHPQSSGWLAVALSFLVNHFHFEDLFEAGLEAVDQAAELLEVADLDEDGEPFTRAATGQDREEEAITLLARMADDLLDWHQVLEDVPRFIPEALELADYPLFRLLARPIVRGAYRTRKVEREAQAKAEEEAAKAAAKAAKQAERKAKQAAKQAERKANRAAKRAAKQAEEEQTDPEADKE